MCGLSTILPRLPEGDGGIGRQHNEQDEQQERLGVQGEAHEQVDDDCENRREDHLNWNFRLRGEGTHDDEEDEQRHKSVSDTFDGYAGRQQNMVGSLRRVTEPVSKQKSERMARNIALTASRHGLELFKPRRQQNHIMVCQNTWHTGRRANYR